MLECAEFQCDRLSMRDLPLFQISFAEHDRIIRQDAGADHLYGDFRFQHRGSPSKLEDDDVQLTAFRWFTRINSSYEDIYPFVIGRHC
ncbi:hypothetical protein D3C85_1714380 [compost metagenome]